MKLNDMDKMVPVPARKLIHQFHKHAEDFRHLEDRGGGCYEPMHDMDDSRVDSVIASLTAALVVMKKFRKVER